MRDAVTTFLDALGLLAVAAGATAGVYRWLGWAALAVGGVVVLAGVQLAERVPRAPRPAGDS